MSEVESTQTNTNNSDKSSTYADISARAASDYLSRGKLPRYGASSNERTYRLANFDRLAQRHNLYNGSGESFNGFKSNNSDSNAPLSPKLHDSLKNSNLHSKREMFFRGESTVANALVGSPNVPRTALHQQTPQQNSLHSEIKRTASEYVSSASSNNTTSGSSNSVSGTPRLQSSSFKSDTAAVSAAPSAREPVPEPVHVLKEQNHIKCARPEIAPKPHVATITQSVHQTPDISAPLLEKRTIRRLDDYVGFANLPNQIYRHAVKTGFSFTLMVVGESGLGKSTLINSMFLSDIYGNEHPGPSRRLKKTIAVEKTVVRLAENGVNLTLTVVDTPGFGDAVDNSNCWQPIIDYIESGYEQYLQSESRLCREADTDSCASQSASPHSVSAQSAESLLADTRVHCCLYFIPPSGHNLKPLDVEFMRRLHDKVNIIPVIAKSDTLTCDEVARFKKQIMEEIARHKIKVYEFPDVTEDGDDVEEVSHRPNRSHSRTAERPKTDVGRKVAMPFAVVGANSFVEVDGVKVRGRKYPWGTVLVDNVEHSDFIPLRNMLVRTHMMDLRSVTNMVHYENYRVRKLAGVNAESSQGGKVVNKNPLAQIEDEKREYEQKIRHMETEMEQVFEMKVHEKENKLKDSEEDLISREQQMRVPLEQQRKELAERRAQFEKEKSEWEQVNGVSLRDLRHKHLTCNSKEAVDLKKKKKGIF